MRIPLTRMFFVQTLLALFSVFIASGGSWTIKGKIVNQKSVPITGVVVRAFIHDSTTNRIISDSARNGGLFVLSGSTSAITDPGSSTSTSFGLSANYPNPFNPSTNVEFSIPSRAHVSLRVYDLLGRSIARFVEGDYVAGLYETTIELNGNANGVYFAVLESRNENGQIERATQKLLLLYGSQHNHNVVASPRSVGNVASVPRSPLGKNQSRQIDSIVVFGSNIASKTVPGIPLDADTINVGSIVVDQAPSLRILLSNCFLRVGQDSMAVSLDTVFTNDDSTVYACSNPKIRIKGNLAVYVPTLGDSTFHGTVFTATDANNPQLKTRSNPFEVVLGSVKLLRDSLSSLQVGVIQIDGLSMESSNYSGRMDSLNVGFQRGDTNHLSFVVPNTIAGAKKLTVNVSGYSITLPIHVVALAPVSNPRQFVVSRLTNLGNWINSLASSLASLAKISSISDSAKLQSDITALNSMFNIAMTEAQTAPDSSILALASFMNANGWLYDSTSLIAASAGIAAKTVGEADPEQLAQELEPTVRQRINELLFYAGVTAVSCGAVQFEICLPAAIWSAYKIYRFNADLIDNFVKPAIVQTIGPDVNSSSIGAARQRFKVNTSSPIEFVSGEKKSLVFYGTYRNVSRDDLGSNQSVMVTLIDDLRRYRDLWNKVKSALGGIPNTTSYQQDVFQLENMEVVTTNRQAINPAYLSVSSVAGQDIDVTSSFKGDSIEFTVTSSVKEQDFTFSLKYQNPGIEEIVVSINARLISGASLELSTKSIQFGNVKVNGFKDTTIAISNTGQDTLQISSISSTSNEFSVRPAFQILAPYQSFYDTIRFVPKTIGSVSASIVIASNDGSGSDTISVSGNSIDSVKFTFDGTYTSSTLFSDGWLHVEQNVVSGTSATGHHSFSKGSSAGYFDWQGTLTRSPSDSTVAILSGSGTITNNGVRNFTLTSSSIKINADGTATMYWGGNDPLYGPIGGVSYRSSILQ